MPRTTTVRVRRETRERINRLAAARGVSAADLIRELVDRADDDALLAAHAAAFEGLRRREPELLRAIEREDRAWERSDLAAPPRDAG